MKIMNKMNVAKTAVATVLTTFAVSANAAVPQAVTDAIGTAKDDATQMAGLILSVLVVFFGWRIIKRFL